MTSAATLAGLRAAQHELRALVENLDEEGYRTQFHPDLSPLGWHLGHCTFIENYWLREVVRDDGSLTGPLAHYYIPANSFKPERGSVLPDREELLAEVRRQQDANLRLLSETTSSAHPLMGNEYLPKFLVQHHSQHIETMHLALAQRAVKNGHNGFESGQPPEPKAVNRACRSVEAGRYRIGGEPPLAFDNELPAHRYVCEEFRIGAHPVSNAEYLAFIENDGYGARRHWSDAGRRWLADAGVSHPDHWRRDARGGWFGIADYGAHDLPPDEPVYGISYHEARAFAAWTGARLPHEYEWEIASRAGLLAQTGRVWEWCDNTFHPYAGFKAFPYVEYSLPWFDGAHYSLRGASRYTRPALRRASFRNFYTPDKRHILAGLRLAFENE